MQKLKDNSQQPQKRFSGAAFAAIDSFFKTCYDE